MSDKIREAFEARWKGHLNLDRTQADDRYLNEVIELAFACFMEGTLAQQPAPAAVTEKMIDAAIQKAHGYPADHLSREFYRLVIEGALAAPAAPVAQELVEVYLVRAEEDYEAPIVLRAFTSRVDAEVFARALRDYQEARPEWPVGDAELEEVLLRDKETRAWMAAHPGGEDAAWCRFFSVIAVPLSAAPTAAEQPDTVKVPRELYTCVGKGGEYELLGRSLGAGERRLDRVVVYRDTETGLLYHRTLDDFDARMALLAGGEA